MTTLIPCPVDDCGWEHLEPPLPDDADAAAARALASIFGFGVMSQVAEHQRTQRIEAELHGHLEQHTVLDWARTVGKLQQEAQRAVDVANELRRRVAAFDRHMEQCQRRAGVGS